MYQRMMVKALVLILIVSLSSPNVSAASPTLDNLAQQIKVLQDIVNKLIKAKSPQVLGVQSITVSNDLELANALASVVGGETILLAPGRYSAITIQIPYNRLVVGATFLSGKAKSPTSAVTITSANPDNRAIIESIKITGVDNWHIENVVVFRTDLSKTHEPAVQLGGNNLKFSRNVITYGDHTKWTTKQDWYDHVRTAAGMEGKNIEFSYNRITGVGFGLAVGYNSENSHIHHNLVTNYSGDGMRGLGKNDRFEHNIISNATVADANHDDGFQSWSYNQVTKTVGTGISQGVIFRNNSILHSTESHPQRVGTQGFGLFDGPFKDWVVENNLIVVDHWHGISMYGPINSLIQNNVSVDPVLGAPGGNWLKFFNHKNGTVPENSRLLNNYANSAQGSSTGVVAEGNTKIAFADYSKYFVDPTNSDYTPKAGAFPFSVGSNLKESDLPKPVNYSVALPPIIPGTASPAVPVTPTVPTIPTTPATTTVPAGIITLTTLPGRQCAVETGQCQFTGTKDVYYGAQGKYLKKTATASIACTSAAFGGDPIYGIKKSCYISAEATTPVVITPPAQPIPPTPTTPTVSTTTDIIEPKILVSGLRNNSELSSIATITATPKNFSTVPIVSYKIDTGAWQILSVPYQFTINPTAFRPGRYRLTVKAQSGDISENRVLNFTVSGTSTVSSNSNTLPEASRWQTTGNVNLRTQPQGSVVRILPGNTEVTRTGVTENAADGVTWIQVKTLNGQIGFVHSRYIRIFGTATTISLPQEQQALVATLRQKIAELQLLLQALTAPR